MWRGDAGDLLQQSGCQILAEHRGRGRGRDRCVLVPLVVGVLQVQVHKDESGHHMHRHCGEVEVRGTEVHHVFREPGFDQLPGVGVEAPAVVGTHEGLGLECAPGVGGHQLMSAVRTDIEVRGNTITRSLSLGLSVSVRLLLSLLAHQHNALSRHIHFSDRALVRKQDVHVTCQQPRPVHHQLLLNVEVFLFVITLRRKCVVYLVRGYQSR